jgi:hypothetical protein
MHSKMNKLVSCIATVIFALSTISCGGGLPIQVKIDDFTMEIDLGTVGGAATEALQSTGVLAATSSTVPEVWPDSLPDISYYMDLTTSPVAVDLTPPPNEGNTTYDAINTASSVISRIDLNRLTLRVEQNTINVPLPYLELQVAPEADSSPYDRKAWRTIGFIEESAAGAVKDHTFQFVKGGETYLNTQLADDLKEFSIRIRGKLKVNTEEFQGLPRGKAVVRLIAVATFYLDVAKGISIGADQL